MQLQLDSLPLHDAQTQSLSYFRREAAVHTGSLIAANRRFVCYAIRANGIIRAIHRPSESLCLLRGHTKEVVDMKLLPACQNASETSDEKEYLASVANDQSVIVWNLIFTGTEVTLRRTRRPAPALPSLLPSIGACHLLSAHAHPQVNHSQLLNLKWPIETPVGVSDRIALRAAHVPSGTPARVAAVLSGSRLLLWDLTPELQVEEVPHELGPRASSGTSITCLAFAPDASSLIASGASDGRVTLRAAESLLKAGETFSGEALEFEAHGGAAGVSLVGFIASANAMHRLLTCGHGSWEMKLWAFPNGVIPNGVLSGCEPQLLQTLSVPGEPKLRATPLLASFAPQARGGAVGGRDQAAGREGGACNSFWGGWTPRMDPQPLFGHLFGQGEAHGLSGDGSPEAIFEVAGKRKGRDFG